MDDTSAQAKQQTRTWLERAVIGLNLCPFAKAVHVKNQIHYEVSAAASAQQLLVDLDAALADLVACDAATRDTTLLIAPYCLRDFLDFNEFMGDADDLLAQRDLEGVIQLASFHPLYQFAGTSGDDITNFTNRSPYPTVHLLREGSVERAVQAFPQAEAIFEANMETLQQLGLEGWNALRVGAAR